MPSFIEALEPPYSSAVAAELSSLMGGNDREPLLLFRTLVCHLPLTKAWGTLGAHNLGRGALTMRDRELVILRTCFLGGCEYEWGVHIRIFAGAAGFSSEQQMATGRPDVSAGDWSVHDFDVLRFAEELHAHSRISEELRAGLRAAWDDAQFLEACEIAGFYHGVAYMANVAEVPLESWGARFPN
ncbi:MAG: carboxymuconolactone decarboxylase family protein [bacterium]